MLDYMTMPVLFLTLFGAMALVTIGVFLALRITGGRIKASDEEPRRRTRRPKLRSGTRGVPMP